MSDNDKDKEKEGIKIVEKAGKSPKVREALKKQAEENRKGNGK